MDVVQSECGSEMIVRQEHLQKLEPFCKAMREAIGRGGFAPDTVAQVFRTAVSAQCLQCGVYVTGDELLFLSQHPPETGDSARIKRLRLGDCAQQGCNSYYYRFNLAPVAALDWTTLLSQVETAQQEKAAPTLPEAPVPTSGKAFSYRKAAPRLWAALGIILLLLVLRQWYVGGRIPFLREPENFRVDPAPLEETEIREAK